VTQRKDPGETCSIERETALDDAQYLAALAASERHEDSHVVDVSDHFCDDSSL